MQTLSTETNIVASKAWAASDLGPCRVDPSREELRYLAQCASYAVKAGIVFA